MYTKGEWTLEKVINTPSYNAQDVMQGEQTVARIYFDERGRIYPKENYAQLIASAPDMYEALKAYSELHITKTKDGDCAIISLNALDKVNQLVIKTLAKVEGNG